MFIFITIPGSYVHASLMGVMQVLIAAHGGNVEPGIVKATVEEMSPLVNDTDLLIAALSLTFCTTLLQRQPQQSVLVTDRVLPPAMTLSKSPLLQVLQLCILHVKLVPVRISSHKLKRPGAQPSKPTPSFAPECQPASNCFSPRQQTHGQQVLQLLYRQWHLP